MHGLRFLIFKMGPFPYLAGWIRGPVVAGEADGMQAPQLQQHPKWLDWSVHTQGQPVCGHLWGCVHVSIYSQVCKCVCLFKHVSVCTHLCLSTCR